MAQYCKKPVIIEAWQIGSDETMPEWLLDAIHDGTVLDVSVYAKADGLDYEFKKQEFVIHTLEGDHIGSYGDYIIKGVVGELYPCKPDIFKQTYEPVFREIDDEFETSKKINSIGYDILYGEN